MARRFIRLPQSMPAKTQRAAQQVVNALFVGSGIPAPAVIAPKGKAKAKASAPAIVHSDSFKARETVSQLRKSCVYMIATPFGEFTARYEGEHCPRTNNPIFRQHDKAFYTVELSNVRKLLKDEVFTLHFGRAPVNCVQMQGVDPACSMVNL